MDKITEIRNLCQEKQIRMIDFKMTDIDGRWRHITIPVELVRGGYRLPTVSASTAPITAMRPLKKAIWCSCRIPPPPM